MGCVLSDSFELHSINDINYRYLLFHHNCLISVMQYNGQNQVCCQEGFSEQAQLDNRSCSVLAQAKRHIGCRRAFQDCCELERGMCRCITLHKKISLYSGSIVPKYRWPFILKKNEFSFLINGVVAKKNVQLLNLLVTWFTMVPLKSYTIVWLGYRWSE
jgi:hypothetical protein